MPCTRKSTSKSRRANHVAHRALERPDELAADDLALALGVGDACERLEERVLGVDGDQLGARRGDEVALYLSPLARAQQPVVDEHARQPVTDRALHQRRGDRRVDAAGQAADRAAVTDLAAHLLDQRVGDVGSRPRRADTGELVQEPAQHLLAVRRVQHLGVVLHAREPARRGPRTPRPAPRCWWPTTSKPSGASVTASPWLIHTGWVAGRSECSSPASDAQLGAAVLAGAGARHGTAERLRHRLESVADAEHRNVEVEQRGVELRRAVGVHAGRPAGQHDRAGSWP